MNPEEEFALMRDESLWKVAPLRARTLAKKPSPWALQFIVPVVTAAVVATLVVVGINGLRDAAPLPPAVVTPVPSETPTATPTPTLPHTPEVPAESLPWQSPPDLVFGGDCSAVFSGDEISTALDWDLPKPDEIDPEYADINQAINLWPSRLALRHNGGMECRWSSPADYEGEWMKNPRLIVRIAPSSAAVEYVEPPFCEDSGEVGCPFAFEFNGYLLSGRIYKAEHLVASLDYLESAFANRVSKMTTVPGSFERRAGDWPDEIDCGKLGENSALASEMGMGPYTAERVEPDDWYLIDTALAKGHGETGCSFSSQNAVSDGPGAYFGINVLSGGSWIRSELQDLPGIQVASIPGADAALISTVNPGEGDISQLYIFVGTNVFTISPDLSFAAPAMIDALNSL